MPPTQDGDRTENHLDLSGGADGTVIQVGALHGDVHTAPAHRRRVPRQAPAPPRHFTDREREARRLLLVCRQVRREGRGRVVVLSGTGGVGKTALATHFLEHHADSFPDGILYADLQGFSDSGPADTGDVLDGFLRSLHTDPGSIPRDAGGRAAAFRSHTHGLRMAVLLDNAVSAAQVRQLTPGRGGHLVLVTTRLHLAGLRLDGADLLDLHPLDEREAVLLVERMLSDGRTADEPASARELVTLCGRLPLALRAAVSGLTSRPRQPLSRMVSRLTGEQRRLAELSHTREPSVDAVFTTSYVLLPAPARRLYRLVGLFPGRELTADAAASLVDGTVEDTEDVLTELLSANLLEETSAGRFRQHDLVRLHARARAEDDEEPAEREAGLDRVLGLYLATAAAADRVLNPGRWHLAPVFDEPPRRGFGSRTEALGWLEGELDTLRACVRFAHDSGRHALCWQLCETLRNLFLLRKHFDAWEETCALGLSSAEALDDPAARGAMLSALGTLRLHLDEAEPAGRIHHRALEQWTRAGHALGRAMALESCGVCELALGRPERAPEFFRSALGIHEDLGRHRGVALMSRRLGEAARDTGDHDAAVGHFTRALAFFDPVAEPYMRVRTLLGLAAVHMAEHDHGAARQVLDEASRLGRRTGALAEQARAQTMLAELALADGRTEEARELLTLALSTRTEIGDPHTERTRRRLDSLPPSPRK